MVVAEQFEKTQPTLTELQLINNIYLENVPRLNFTKPILVTLRERETTRRLEGKRRKMAWKPKQCADISDQTGKNNNNKNTEEESNVTVNNCSALCAYLI